MFQVKYFVKFDEVRVNEWLSLHKDKIVLVDIKFVQRNTSGYLSAIIIYETVSKGDVQVFLEKIIGDGKNVDSISSLHSNNNFGQNI